MKKLMIALAMIFGLSLNNNATEERKDGETLTLRQQKLVVISSLTAKGDLGQLKTALDGALVSGLTVNEIKEAIVQLYAYCGFPRSIRGLQTFMGVLDARKARGITDKRGPEATPVNSNRSKYDRGKAIAGYITIAADAAYQGASGGEPRHTDKPANRIEDIHGMADCITQFAGVDAKRLGVLGICGGGGYTLKAVQSDKRFKAVATLSMFNSGEVRRNGFQNTQLATIQERLKQASAARAQEAAGSKIIYAGVAGITDEEIAKTSTDLYREGYEYYYRSHAHPNSTFLYTMSSLFDLMTWDATTNMDLIEQPLLMIAGSKADTKYMTDEAFPKATRAKNKELFLIDGATHIQTYWKPEYVLQAVNKLVDFYQTNL